MQKDGPLQQKGPHYRGPFYQEMTIAECRALTSIPQSHPQSLAKLNPNHVTRSRPGHARTRLQYIQSVCRKRRGRTRTTGNGSSSQRAIGHHFHIEHANAKELLSSNDLRRSLLASIFSCTAMAGHWARNREGLGQPSSNLERLGSKPQETVHKGQQVESQCKRGAERRTGNAHNGSSAHHSSRAVVGGAMIHLVANDSAYFFQLLNRPIFRPL